MEILPAIDIRGGKCVRLVQGDYARETVFGDDPAAMARHWEEHGATRLHVVDLDGAREGVPRNLAVVEEILKEITIPVQLGGGIRNPRAAQRVLDMGIDRIIVGTFIWLHAVGTRERVNPVGMRKGWENRLIAGVDARDGRVAVRGWADETDLDAVDFTRALVKKGIRWIVFTDIGSDGMLAGPNVESLRRVVEVAKETGASVIASGGITTVEDVKAVKDTGAAAAIIGRALYEGRVTLEEAMEAAC